MTSTISTHALIETTDIGSALTVHPFAYIKNGVKIGNNVVIHSHVVIEPGVEIGDNVEIFPGAYIGKEPKGVGATARTPLFERRVVIGEYCSIGPHAVLYYDTVIGKNTLIGDHASIREKVTIGDFCIISRGVTINYNSHIGNRTKIMDLSHITGNCEIGDDVFISLLVATTNDKAIGQLGYQEDRIRGPRIGNGSMIGAGANLLPGVIIGEHCIVGASAVVSKDVPDYKMVMGIPARVIRDLRVTLVEQTEHEH